MELSHFGQEVVPAKAVPPRKSNARQHSITAYFLSIFVLPPNELMEKPAFIFFLFSDMKFLNQQAASGPLGEGIL
jgi:hypothetical protein